MKWADTVASSARYGDVAGRIFGDAEIIWEASTNDYQGSCDVLALLPTGEFVHYEWTYGSCSGCDTWEHQYGYGADDDIEREMRKEMVTFPDVATLQRYLHTDNLDDWLGGEDFKAMGEAFEKWRSTHVVWTKD